MAVSDQLDSVIQRALGDVFEAHLPALRAEIARRVTEQLGPAAPVSNHTGIPEITTAVQAIQSAASQTDVLTALLNGATQFASRAALFVVRSGNAIGWQARGLDEHVLKALHLNTNQGTIGRVTRDCVTVMAPVRDFDPGFASAMGIAAELECLAVPLVVKDRVAALMYADGVSGEPMNAAALELLVRSTALWLEVLTTRKATAAAAATSGGATETMCAAEKVVEAVSPASKTPVPQVVAEPPAPPTQVVEAPTSAPAPALAAAEPAPQDQEIHNKARRFAKLLVDEIKLYNQEKVTQGKQNKNLYDALRDDIDKSRATYEKRYSTTPAATGDYFNKELIRILADNDASLLGSNYPG